MKILLASFIPLFSDETYYWIWSNHLQLSYFDHPGMVAWLIKLGGFIFPYHSPLSVRLLFVVLSTISLTVWALLLKQRHVSEKNIFYFLILVCLNPLLGVGSIIATPDVPLVFFWSLSFYFLNQIFTNSKIRHYAFLGISLGLGFCSKYHIVLFALSSIFGLLVQKNYKKIRITGVLITIVLGLIFSLPVLIWNSQNDWASFLFQLKHGFGRPTYKFEWTSGYILGQFLLIGPIIFLSLFKKPFSTLDRIFSLSQLTFFLTSSFKSVVEANWPITSHLHAIKDFVELRPNYLKFNFYYWGIIYILLAIAFSIPTQRQKIFSSQQNTLSISELTENIKTFSPLYGPTYQISSLLSWNLEKTIPKLRGLSRHDFFDTLPESIPNQKEFYVLRDIHSGWPNLGFPYTFEKIKNFPDLELELFRIIRSDEVNE